MQIVFKKTGREIKTAPHLADDHTFELNLDELLSYGFEAHLTVE
ncbi:MAG TPA: hypothetical protein VFS21_17095 [Roseiflexaceae bacterium]|nr:hypothetical protein [Roseiflexaceae bacterium]